MGKGDKKSRRGKIILGTYGKRRPRKSHNTAVKPVEEVMVKEPKKKESAPAVAEKTEKKEAKAPKDKAPRVQKEKKESGEKKDKKS